MAKKKISKTKSHSKDDSKVFAFIATFFSIVGFIIALVAKKDDKYVMFYAKQSLVLFIVALIASIINSILAWLPIIGGIISGIISLFVTILWILTWIYALSEEEKDVPFISEYAKKLNL